MAKVFLFPEGKDFGVDKGLYYSDPFFPLFPELTSYCQSSNEFIKFFQHHKGPSGDSGLMKQQTVL